MAAKVNHKQLIKRMATDLELYSKLCLHIRTKGDETGPSQIVPFEWNDEQTHINQLLKQQYKDQRRVRAIVLKARQVGVSTYTAARFFRRFHLFPNQRAVVIADEIDRAAELFLMYDRFAAYLPEEMRPMTRFTSKQKQLWFDNPKDQDRGKNPGLGGGIQVETAGDAAAGRGATIQLVHCSEMGTWPNAEDVYISLIQAVPDYESEVLIESTANGVGNLFHNMWLEAEAGENGFVPIFLPWWAHKPYTLPLKDDEKHYVLETLNDEERQFYEEGVEWKGEFHKLTLGQLAWRRKTIREKTLGDVRAFRQEYPATPEEAFLTSGNCFFDEEELKRYDLASRGPLMRANLVKEGGGGIRCRRAEMGYLRIWELPQEGKTYVIGCDTATGRQVSARDTSFADPDAERGGRDFSSADVYSVRDRRLVAQLHGRMAPEVLAEQLYLLGHFYASESAPSSGQLVPSLLAVEKNHSSGETVLRLLQQHHRYPRLYYGKQINRRANRVTQVLGWVTSQETRMPMLDELAQAVRERTIDLRNPDTIREMFTFIRGEDGKPEAQEGCHDDRVISLAIAMQAARNENSAYPKNWDRNDRLVGAGTSPTGFFDW